MTSKPPVPTDLSAPWPVIPVNLAEGGDFDIILRAAGFAADAWTFGPTGPYSNPSMTGAATTRGQIREALLYLMETGFIDIDTERLHATDLIPMDRRGLRS
jgi:hypothetical protein